MEPSRSCSKVTGDSSFACSFPWFPSVLAPFMSTLPDSPGETGSGASVGLIDPFPDQPGKPYQLDEAKPKKKGSKKKIPLLKQLKPFPKNKLFAGEPKAPHPPKPKLLLCGSRNRWPKMNASPCLRRSEPDIEGKRTPDADCGTILWSTTAAPLTGCCEPALFPCQPKKCAIE